MFNTSIEIKKNQLDEFLTDMTERSVGNVKVNKFVLRTVRYFKGLFLLYSFRRKPVVITAFKKGDVSVTVTITQKLVVDITVNSLNIPSWVKPLQDKWDMNRR